MPGGGALTIRARDEGDHMAIAVCDTGCGISPAHVEKLFQPLFTTKPTGIGLGLAISKNLVEANGGRIDVETTAGTGSCFTITLPTEGM
jgi:signal transduction histidine kinase